MTRLETPNSDAFLVACTASSFAGVDGTCRWCAGEVKPPRRRWCSNECNHLFGANHFWGFARNHVAAVADGRCARCGRSYSDPKDGPFRELTNWRNEPYRLALDRKGETLGTQVHHLTPLHTLPLITVQVRWRPDDLGGPIMETRKVRHGDNGCWHHVDGLELLCTDCHLDAHAGEARARAADPAQTSLDMEAA